MNCSETRRKLPAFSDGELAPDDHDRLSRHVSSCPDCRKELAQLQILGPELDRFETTEADPYFITRLKQRIAFQAANHHSRWAWLRRVALPTGAAAAILVAALTGSILGRAIYERGHRSSALTATTISSQSDADLFGAPDGSLLQVCDRIFTGSDNE
jgi:anti-sigma factor RsiW